MATNIINLKIKVDNKEAVASLELTDDNVKELYRSFKYGKQEVNGMTTAISQGFNNAREIMQGAREVYNAFQQSFGKAIDAYGKQEAAERKVAQAIQSTGATAGFTASELNKLASELQSISTFGDEIILNNATAQLLTFTNIAGDNFKRVQQAALDVSTVLSTGPEDAANRLKDVSIQLGKALNDPVANLGALSRAGIQFSDEQEKTIKGLAQTNRLAEAQSLILTELEKQYGGQAAALAQTSSGALVQFNNLMGDLNEKVGGAISTALIPLTKEVSKFFTVLNEVDPRLTGIIGTTGMVTAGLVTLRVTGIGPAIFSFNTFRASVQSARVQMALASMGSQTFAGSVTMASTAVKGFFASLGPGGWLILGLTTVVTLTSLFADETDNLNSKIDTSKQKIGEETEKFKFLADRINDTNSSLEERNTALNQLQEAYPGFLSNLDLEKTSNEDIAKAVNESIAAYEKRIALQIYQDELDKVLVQKVKKEEEYNNALARQTYLETKLNEAKERGVTSQAFITYTDELDLQKEKVSNLKNEVENFSKDSESIYKKINAFSFIDKNNKTEQITLQTRINELKKREKTLTDEYLALSPEEAEKKKSFYENELTTIQKQIENLTLKAKEQGKEIKVPVKLDIDSFYEDPLIKNPESALDDIDINEAKLPVTLGTMDASNWDEIEKQRREDDLFDWYNYEDQKLQMYDNYSQLKISLDEEYAERKKELDNEVLQNQLSATADVLGGIGALFGKHTAAYKAFAVVQTVIDTYQAAQGAYKAMVGIPVVGPALAIAAAGSAIASGMARVAAIESQEVPGYAQGGRLEKGKSGFVEGYYNEIIAPEKTFVELFKSELRPQIYAGMGNDNSDLYKEIKGLRSDIQSYNKRPLNANLTIGKRSAKDITVMGTNEINKRKLN